MVPEAIDALRILNDHPDTTFTVLTGEGRFFCAGADVRGMFLTLPNKLLPIQKQS
jgi:peroxisomal 3,2-trans-enoyl-CoA isomerase